MDIRKTSIADLVILEPRIFPDDRGFFTELFKTTTFQSLGLPLSFVQDNMSESSKGTLRGLHFQVPPTPQGKLVFCLIGSIWDVAVDLRKGSPTFGKWDATTLKATEPRGFYVPPGFAHGFQALEDGTRVFYKCTGLYSKVDERGIRYNDSELNIKWPLSNPLVTDKDLKLPGFSEVMKSNPF